MKLVPRPTIASPVNNAPLPGSKKAMWSDVCPGVWTARRSSAPARTRWPARSSSAPANRAAYTGAPTISANGTAPGA